MAKLESSQTERSKTLFRLSVLCLAASFAVALVATALGIRIRWPVWLLLAAPVLGLVSTAIERDRPAVSQYLVLVMAVMSIAAVVGIVAMHP